MTKSELMAEINKIEREAKALEKEYQDRINDLRQRTLAIRKQVSELTIKE